MDPLNSMEKHFMRAHKVQFLGTGSLTEQEAQDVMETIASYEQHEIEEL